MLKKAAAILGVIYLSLLFVCFAEESETAMPTGKVRIAKIKIVIDGNEYEWAADGVSRINAESGAGETLRAETIISFLSLRPNDTATESEMRRQCRASELRLLESGYVYDASLQIVPPRKNPAERTIVVTVTSGFFWRFGGGGIFGMIGKDGLGGNRASVRLYGGWNLNGIKYVDYHAGGTPFVLGGSLFYLGPGKNKRTTLTAGTANTGVPLEAAVTTGYFLSPGLLAGVDGTVCLPDVLPGGNTLFSVQPFAQYRKYLVPGDPERYGNESDAGFDVRGYIYPTLSAEKGEASAFIHGRILDKTMIAVKGAGGVSLGDAVFDLFLTEDRSVRSGYSGEDLYVPSFALCSAEIRQSVASFTVPPAFNYTMQIFGFTDIAYLSGETRFADAYGVGARMLFDNPVFAYFTFSYGVNHAGSGRFIFCGTAGF
jgi:hypothetical protein